MVKAPIMTTWAQHINYMYNFFWSHIGEDKGLLIGHIDTEE